MALVCCGAGTWLLVNTAPKPGFPTSLHFSGLLLTLKHSEPGCWQMPMLCLPQPDPRSFGNHSSALIFLLSPALSLFPKQIWENDQWDVPGGDCAADPDWPDKAGSPLPWADFRASPDQGHLWNQVPVTDWKVCVITFPCSVWEALTWTCCCHARVRQIWDLKIKQKGQDQAGVACWGCPRSSCIRTTMWGCAHSSLGGEGVGVGPAACPGPEVPKLLHRS